MPKNVKRLFQAVAHPKCISTGLLLVRLVAGCAFAHHGWQKMQSPMGWMGPQAPVPGFLQFLAAFSEFGGGIAWMLGLITPVACFGIFCTMLVATSMHMFVMKDPFVASGPGQGAYEPAMVYLSLSILLFLAGPGKFSLDSKIFGEKKPE